MKLLKHPPTDQQLDSYAKSYARKDPERIVAFVQELPDYQQYIEDPANLVGYIYRQARQVIGQAA